MENKILKAEAHISAKGHILVDVLYETENEEKEWVRIKVDCQAVEEEIAFNERSRREARQRVKERYEQWNKNKGNLETEK